MTDGTKVVGTVPAPTSAQTVQAPTMTVRQVPTANPAVAPTTLAAKTNAAQAGLVTIPKGLVKGNTRDLDRGFFHFILYGPTSARKTTTAALAETPEFTRIILDRRKEQLRPLQRLSYEYCQCETTDAIVYALTYPEKIWPDWAAMADPDQRRLLILDDVTEAVDMLVDENSVVDGKEAKFGRQYMAAKKEIGPAIKSVLRKPYNFGMVALAKVKDDPIKEEEEIGPDLPPMIRSVMNTEFEYVFYIDVDKWVLKTDRDSFVYTAPDPESGKQRNYRRKIFAKSKAALGAEVLKKEEPMDLRAIWKKVREARVVGQPGQQRQGTEVKK